MLFIFNFSNVHLKLCARKMMEKKKKTSDGDMYCFTSKITLRGIEP